MTGIPVEALLVANDSRTVSYALRPPCSSTCESSLDPTTMPACSPWVTLSTSADNSSEPKPLPDHGLLVNIVAPGSIGATHGLKAGDVLLGVQRHGHA